MALQNQDATDSYDNATVVIKGGTDNTSIGNVGDALKTTTAVTSMPSSVTTIETEHNRIHSGLFYSYCDFFTLANSGTQHYEIETTSKTFHFLLGIITNGIVEIELYEAPTATTSGNDLGFVQHNRTSANTCSSTIKLVSSITTNGTRLYCAGIGSSNGNSSGTQLLRNEEFILKTSTKYLIKITSRNSNNTVTAHFTGYETS